MPTILQQDSFNGVFTIHASFGFAEHLARHMVAMAQARAKKNPNGQNDWQIELSDFTLYLPNRRSAGVVRAALLQVAQTEAERIGASGGGGLLLPRILSLGDIGDDAMDDNHAEDSDDGDDDDKMVGFDGGDMAKIIPLSSARRLRILMTLIEAFYQKEFIRDIKPGHLLALAKKLARFFDELTIAEQDKQKLFSTDILSATDDEEMAMIFENTAIEDLIDNLAEHWKHVLNFLKIIVPRYDEILSDMTVAENPNIIRLDREQILNRRMAALTDSYQRNRTNAPVIIAGSTGSRASTRKLMQAVLTLENGMVVLPGFDKDMEEEIWRFLSTSFYSEHKTVKKKSGDASAFLLSAMVHPQRTMVNLLQFLAMPRDAVQYFHQEGVGSDIIARQKLLAEIFLPPIKNWQQRLDETLPNIMTTALKDVTMLTLHDRENEARMIGLIIKKQLVENNKTIAVVTRDRQLVRQLLLVLQGMGVMVEDSAGTPFWQTRLGIFLSLASHFFSHANQQHLKSLLLHPWVMMATKVDEADKKTDGADKKTDREFASKIVADILPRIRGGLTAEKLKAAIIIPPHGHDGKEDMKKVKARQEMVEWLEPITQLLSKKNDNDHEKKSMTVWLQEFIDFLDQLTIGGDNDIFAGDVGQKLKTIVDRLMSDSPTTGLDDFTMTRVDFHDWFYELLVDETLHRPFLKIPRLNIVGPLESRLLKLDITILAGLSEGIWPRGANPDPWLPKPIRKQWKLSSDEEKLSLSAHDFATNFLSPEVFLLHHEKENGVALEKSRWLQRLEALLAVHRYEDMATRARRWYDTLTRYDAIEHQWPSKRAARPAPNPPRAARPKKLSVTNIKKWQDNPFWLYGNKILALKKPLAADSGSMAKDKGTLLHDILRKFILQKEKHKGEEEALLYNLCDEALVDYQTSAAAKVFWQGLFYSSCKFFWQEYQQLSIHRSLVEVKGEAKLSVDGYDFTLTARADRIDIGDKIMIIDYKTGSLKKPGESLQLPLEGWLVRQNGFADIKKKEEIGLQFWQLKGWDKLKGQDKSEIRDFPKKNKKGLTKDDDPIEWAKEILFSHIKNLADPNYKFEAVEAQKFNDYDLLAREGEWASGIGEEEEGESDE